YAWKYLHQGGRWDTDAGAYSFRYREYSPTLGRWLQMDPIGFAGTKLTLYAYESNSPPNGRDPSGLLKVETTSAEPPSGGAGGGCGLVGVNGGQAKFKFTLDRPAIADGYLVQHVTTSYSYSLCPCLGIGPCLHPSDKRVNSYFEYWEAFPVKAGQTTPADGDTQVISAGDGHCGSTVVTGEV